MSDCTIAASLAQLQEEVGNCENVLLELIQVKKMMSENIMGIHQTNVKLKQTPIAIIGMASIFPQARNLQEYWENIIRKVDCITDVPSSRWDVETYYDPDPNAPDKTYCKRGGFIPDIDFNPIEFGLPPNLIEVTDISQLLSLVVAKQAMEDAGYGEFRDFDREHTGVILGATLGRQLTLPFGSRLQHPTWEKVLKSSGLSDEDTQKIIEKIKSAYCQWEENSFPGLLGNVIAGRVANRLNFGGTNCVIDAACASSLAAFKMAFSELLEHRCNMVLTGGVDTDNSIFTYLCFSKTPALSKSQNVRPFDVDSDGMMLGEGIGMMVLKRLDDAERDRDKIYAVIKGIGTSSDGRYKSIYAPRAEGQVNALRRAYQDAGTAPMSVGLIEAHGTGTLVGDPAEFTALNKVFSENNPRKQHIAIGSVKSQIGHTKAAAGAASLIKAALALHHKLLPPTINVNKPNPKLNIETSPFYLNTETRPWIRSEEVPRRAGVSAFGFGGTNYHVVLEEYESDHNQPYRLHNTAQSILLFAPTLMQLLVRCEDVLKQLQSDAGEKHYAALIDSCKSLEIPAKDTRLGFVSDSLTEARNLLQISIDWLRNKELAESWQHPQGIYYRQAGINPESKVVALFSGQGSQYLSMGQELVINFPCLRQAYSYMDSLLSKDGLKPLSDRVFPLPVFDTAQRNTQVEALTLTEYAQPAIGAFSVGLYKILQQAGFKPDFVAGHSFGELTALWAAEVLSDEDYFFLVKARGQAMAAPERPNFDAGAMLAVKGNVNKVKDTVKDFPQVTIANLNSSNQLVLAGAKSEIAKVQQILSDQGYSTVLLPVSAAFHTPLVGHAQKPFTQAFEAVTFKSAKIPVYSNITGKRYPTEPQAIQKILKEHLINSVLFKHEIENIYGDGGYLFIEFGPRDILTNLVKDILTDRPHLVLALNASRHKDSDRQLREAVVQLRVAGLPLKNLDPFPREQKTPEAQSIKSLNFRLNSTNYVSEKTRVAFEQALQDGHQVKSTITQAAEVISNTHSTMKSTVTQAEVISNTQSRQPLAATSIVDLNSASPEPIRTQPMSESSSNSASLNYQRVLDSLEYSLAQFSQHQTQTLHVHEQYVNSQMEYAKIFFHLMQQQNCLFSNSNSAHQQAETNSSVLESLERNMMRFHDHQAETLRLHEQSLNHQVEYSKNFFQLIQQKHHLLLAGNFHHYPVEPSQSLATVASIQDSPVLTAKERAASKQDGPSIPPATAPIAVPTSELIIKPEPISSNGATPVQKSNPEPISSNGATPVQEALAAQAKLEVTTTVALTLSDTIDLTTLSQTLLGIVSQKTGYPSELLELDMDMEADLGIDSIKRIEILVAMQEQFPDLPKLDPEDLGELRTLGQIIEQMKQQVAEKKNLEMRLTVSNQL